MENQVKYCWVDWLIKPVYKEDEFVEVEFGIGTEVEDAINCAIEISRELTCVVVLRLNEIELKVNQNSKPNLVLSQYVFG